MFIFHYILVSFLQSQARDSRLRRNIA